MQNTEGIPGHPEIELALLRLYRLTENKHFLELAKKFIDERGKAPDFWAREAKKRSWSVWNSDPWDNDYRQSAKPVREQTDRKSTRLNSSHSTSSRMPSSA